MHDKETKYLVKTMFEAYFDMNKRMGYMDDTQIDKLKVMLEIREMEIDMNGGENAFTN